MVLIFSLSPQRTNINVTDSMVGKATKKYLNKKSSKIAETAEKKMKRCKWEQGVMRRWKTNDKKKPRKGMSAMFNVSTEPR